MMKLFINMGDVCARGSYMTYAILRRLLHMVVVLLAMTGGTFLLMRLSPVDPVALHFVAMGTPADPALAVQIRAELGLDDLLIVQYARWLGGLFTGDMGYSIAFGSPVAVLMKEALPRTLELAVLASLMALAVTLPLGILAYRRHGSRVDEAIRIVSFLGISLPTFWVGLLLILVFSVKLRLIPVVATDDLRGMILPSAPCCGSTSCRMR